MAKQSHQYRCPGCKELFNGKKWARHYNRGLISGKCTLKRKPSAYALNPQVLNK